MSSSGTLDHALRVGIVGVGGYTGAELVRIVHAHPRLRLEFVAARDNAGKLLGDVLPATLGVAGLGERRIEAIDVAHAESVAARIDVAFCALPHGASASIVAALHRAGARVVDLSADFRLKSAAQYAEWYGHGAGATHPEPDLLGRAVYGLPELHKDELTGARLIAAPGCYPTSAILPLAPLLRAELIERQGIVIDAKSGVSGAGRAPGPAYHFPQVGEGVRAYKVAGSHRHLPEIEQELARVAGAELRVTFTPHLVPMTRGILSVAYARARAGTTADRCRQAAHELYGDGLVSVLPADKLPDTLWVRGSARAHVAYALDERTDTVLALCAIDNLARGASAQAVQALNVSLGWPEALGLPQLATFP